MTTKPLWFETGRLRSVELDRRCARALHRGAAWPGLQRIFSVFSHLGDAWTWALLILLLPLLDRKQGAAVALVALGLGAVNLTIYWALKQLTRRERPFRQCADIHACVDAGDVFSFPSGHALHAFAFAALLSVPYPAFGPVLWSLAVLVGLSRVVLGVHFPSDVLAGALIGVASGSVAWLVA